MGGKGDVTYFLGSGIAWSSPNSHPHPRIDLTYTLNPPPPPLPPSFSPPFWGGGGGRRVPTCDSRFPPSLDTELSISRASGLSYFPSPSPSLPPLAFLFPPFSLPPPSLIPPLAFLFPPSPSLPLPHPPLAFLIPLLPPPPSLPPKSPSRVPFLLPL